MASFKSTILTQKAHALMAKLTAGTATSTFTKIKSSEYDYSALTSTQLEALTSIEDVKQEVLVSEVTRINEASVKVSATLVNTELTTGYYIKTIALYANDPDEGEILYSITVATESDWMPPYNSISSASALFDLITTVSNAENVSIDVDPGAVATITQLNDVKDYVICNKELVSINHNLSGYPRVNLTYTEYGAGVGGAGLFPAGANSECNSLQNRAVYTDNNNVTIYVPSNYYIENPSVNKINDYKYIVTFENNTKSILISLIKENIEEEIESKADNTDSNRTTSDKTVTGAINELNKNKVNNITVQALQVQVNSLASGAPKAVSLVSQMIDNNKNYVYTGSETGYIAGNWYYYDSSTSSWKSGGVYQSTGIADKSISSKQTSNALSISHLLSKYNLFDARNIQNGKKVWGWDTTTLALSYPSDPSAFATDEIEIPLEASALTIKLNNNSSFEGNPIVFVDSSSKKVLALTMDNILNNAFSCCSYVSGSDYVTINIKTLLSLYSNATKLVLSYPLTQIDSVYVYPDTYKIEKDNIIFTKDMSVDDIPKSFDILKPALKIYGYYSVGKNSDGGNSIVYGNNYYYVSKNINTTGKLTVKLNTGMIATALPFALLNNDSYVAGATISTIQANAYDGCSYSNGYYMLDLDRLYELYGVFNKIVLSFLISERDSNTAILTNYKNLYDFDWINTTHGMELILPKKVHCVVGHEMNMYYENFLLNGRADRVQKLFCIGYSGQTKNYIDELRYIPTQSATLPGQANLFINNTTHVDLQKSFQCIAVPKDAGGNNSRKALVIGDSRTNQGNITQTLLDLFNDSSEAMSLTLLGTRGTNPNLHEGHAGWAAYHYCTQSSFLNQANAFWNPLTLKFDFSYYMSQQGYSGVDYVIIDLGINDMAYTSNEDTIKYMNEILTSIRTYNSSINVIFAPSESYCDTTFGDYNTYVNQKNTILRLTKRILKEYDNRESEKIFICPSYLNVDLVNDFPYELVPISSRNTDVTVKRVTDILHPSIYGNQKVADAMYYCIKYIESIA